MSLIGMLRSQDRRNAFTPENDPARNQWVFADLEAMAEHSGAKPIMVDEIYGACQLSRRSIKTECWFRPLPVGNAGQIGQRLAQGLPVGRAATIEIRNQHLTYAFTWLSPLSSQSPTTRKLTRKAGSR